MRILIVTGIFPPDTGGPASYVPRISAALVERGHTVDVVTLSDQLDHPDAATYVFPVHRIARAMARPLRLARTVATIVRLARRADVVFGNGLPLETALAVKIVRRPLVMKVVGDFAWERLHLKGHSIGFAEFQHQELGMRSEIAKHLRAWWTRQADRIITPSQYLAKAVAGWGVAQNRISIVYNSARLPDVDVAPTLRPLPQPVLVTMVCRLLPLKRVGWALSVLRSLPEVGLVVVGDGPESMRLRSQTVSEGVSDRVHFTGALSHADALRTMAACDVLASLSTHEGLPHVVLEARALGLVIVATDAGGTVEALGSSARHVVVQGDNDAALVQAFREAAARVERGPRVSERDAAFAPETMVSETEALLVDAAASCL